MPEVSEFAVDELAAALHLGRGSAGNRLVVAVELTRLPGTAAALGRGDIDLPRARAVVEAVTPLDDTTAQAVEARVLPRAGAQTAGQLRAALTRAVITADHSDQPGDLAGHGPIPASMARRLAADGRCRRVLTDPATGTIIHIAPTAGYTPSAALAGLVRARDRTCRFPGCRQPAHRCDLDHVTPWPAGPTSGANLFALCRHHHRLKHHTGWHVTIDDHATATWTSPTGHRYRTSPPQAG